MEILMEAHIEIISQDECRISLIENEFGGDDNAEVMASLLMLANLTIRVLSNLDHDEAFAGSLASILHDSANELLEHIMNNDLHSDQPAIKLIPNILEPSPPPTKKKFIGKLVYSETNFKYDFELAIKGFPMFRASTPTVDRCAVECVLGLFKYFVLRDIAYEARPMLYSMILGKCGALWWAGMIEMTNHEKLAMSAVQDLVAYMNGLLGENGQG